ncbi:MAG: glutamyl/glutaminyl-tRNA synthetase [Saprospiraceae bacterium]|jgi:glutamyl/glutaminyl-tRNA synthetase
MSVRVRFAPSPTGPLHIGGVRTALYNYLFARKHGGTFILRVEDTDQGRYVKGAENYVLKALEWLGMELDESVVNGGDFGPYRQSERKELYLEYAQKLIDSGSAYYAFDTSEELTKVREENPTFKYNFEIREQMKTSLAMSAEEVQAKITAGEPYVIRIKIPRDEMIVFDDLVRGRVSFHSDELDDKVMMKGDGMPTYHLANIVDDHLMKITHVIRGEEWLPSTPLHVILYRAFGWEDTMPQFSHLPLILKPSPESYITKKNINELATKFAAEFVKKYPEMAAGEQKAIEFTRMVLQDKADLAARLKIKKKDKEDKILLKEFLKSTMFGKLSKRDGDRLGFPVFPLSWNSGNGVDAFRGFDAFGFLPDALINFLAFLGWNPGTEREIFSINELIEEFEISRVSKSGARFNFDKARWYNQQYIMSKSGTELATLVKSSIAAKGYEVSDDFLASYCLMMKERAETLSDFVANGAYCFDSVATYDEKMIKKRWKIESRELFNSLSALINRAESYDVAILEKTVKAFMEEKELGFGQVFPILRLALSGINQGPSIFEIMALLGRDEVNNRFTKAYDYFDELVKD